MLQGADPPLMTYERSLPILKRVTVSGYVKTLPHEQGRQLDDSKFGSGEITVRAEKSTRFPDKFPKTTHFTF